MLTDGVSPWRGAGGLDSTFNCAPGGTLLTFTRTSTPGKFTRAKHQPSRSSCAAHCRVGGNPSKHRTMSNPLPSDFGAVDRARRWRGGAAPKARRRGHGGRRRSGAQAVHHASRYRGMLRRRLARWRVFCTRASGAGPSCGILHLTIFSIIFSLYRGSRDPTGELPSGSLKMHSGRELVMNAECS